MQLINEVSSAVNTLKDNLPFILEFLGIFWGVFLLNAIVGGRLMVLGVYPRKPFSILGIFFYPFIHGNFNHIFFNSIPLFILSSFVLLLGMQTFIYVTATVIIVSGLATWFFARPGFHIGASGLIMGYWAFLLINAYYHEISVLTVGPAIVCIYYFGGLAFHIFPSDIKTSFEAHLFGAIGGIAAYYSCPLFSSWFHDLFAFRIC